MDERATRTPVPGRSAHPSKPPARPVVPPARPAEGLAPPGGSAPVRGVVASGGSESARGEHVHSEPAAPRAPQRHSVRGQILAALREALLSGELAPGQVYSAPALASRFGVSPTPVREAMQQLAAEGAVETVPNRGFRVAERSPRELAELAEVRVLLEVPTVLALAHSRPAEAWQVLRPLADAAYACAARGDLAGYVVADQSFHRGLVELGGNRQLAALAEELARRSWRAPSTQERLRARGRLHGALLDALVAGDLTRAEEALREQLSP